MQPSGSDVRRSTRRLFVWFLLTTIVPAVALVWLGWVLGRFSLSPDGRTIAYVSGAQAAEVWAVENLVPPAR